MNVVYVMWSIGNELMMWLRVKLEKKIVLWVWVNWSGKTNCGNQFGNDGIYAMYIHCNCVADWSWKKKLCILSMSEAMENNQLERICSMWNYKSNSVMR